MSVKSLQGRRTTYAARSKLMKIKVQNTTVKQMSLEPILESTECWCRSNVGRQTVPHRRTSDGECPNHMKDHLS